MNKAIRYRIYPNEQQKELFAKTFGCCRKVYNLMLADKIKSYEETGKFASVTPAKYKQEYPYLIKAVVHRLPEESWLIKSATVFQESDGKFYVSILFEFEQFVTSVAVSDNAIGLENTSLR